MSKGLKFFVGIIVVLAAIVFTITLTIDGYVKSGIEKNGSELLQTEVRIDDVDISIFGGTGEIEGFVVQNPEGFSNEEAIRFDQVDLKVDLASLFSDQVIVEEMIIKSPVLFFEQKGIGANLKKLNDNMDLSGSEESDKALVVNYLRMENATVKVSTDIDRERNAEATIETFELEGIGREGSNTMQQSLKQIMEPLLQKAMAEAVKGGILEQVKDKVQDLIDGD